MTRISWWLGLVALLGVLVGSSTDVAAARARRGKLKVTCSVDGAEVLVDGKVLATTPMRETSVTAGKHTIKVRKLGYLEFVDKVNIRSGVTEKLKVELLPTAGVIRVSANAPRAVVTVDGQKVGDAPLVREVKVGARVIAVNAPGRKPFSQKIQAEAGQVYVIEAKLAAGGATADELDLAAIPLDGGGSGDGELSLEPIAASPSDGGAGDDTLPGLELLPSEGDVGGGALGVSATLRPVKPWYMQWWAWSAAGAIVTASIATAIVLSNDDESGPTQADSTFPFGGSDHIRNEPRAFFIGF